MAYLRATFLGLALGTLVGPAHADVPAARAESALSRLAASVATRDELTQADFAAIALDAVIDAYERELETMERSTRRLSAGGRAKQSRWARAARSLLEQLYDARYDVDLGEHVEVVASGPGEVQVLVGEQLLPVASPRIARPERLENAVVSSFCSLHACEDAVTDSVARVVLDGSWSFRQGLGSTYLTGDGLGFMFDSIRDRPLKEEVCQRAAAELRDVLAVLRRARALGIAINWQGLRVSAGRGGTDERLVVGFNGQGSRVSMPVLLRAPGVLQVAQPWLRAGVAQRPAQQMFPRSDLLFATLLGG